MKNKKILYLLTVIITLFSFNLNANAAQELTCVYKNGWTAGQKKVILIQYADGTTETYTHSKDVSIEKFGWKLTEHDWSDSSGVSKDKRDESKDLIACPNYTNDSGVYFFDQKDVLGEGHTFFPEELEKTYYEVKEPTYVQLAPPTQLTGEGELIPLDTSTGKYTGTCKYKGAINGGKYHYLQINFGKEHMLITEYDPDKDSYSGLENEFIDEGKEGGVTLMSHYGVWISLDLTTEKFLKMSAVQGDCPPGFKLRRIAMFDYIDREFNIKWIKSIYSEITGTGGEGELYILDAVNGNNPITGLPLKMVGDFDNNFMFDKIDYKSCSDLLGEDIAGYFKIIWNFIKIGIPIILVALGVIDFTQAIFSGKEDGMKKVQEKFIKRIIIAIIIFLIPTILGLLLKIANSVWGNIGEDICGIFF